MNHPFQVGQYRGCQEIPNLVQVQYIIYVKIYHGRSKYNDNTNITLMMTMVIVTLSKVDCEGGTWTGKVEH